MAPLAERRRQSLEGLPQRLNESRSDLREVRSTFRGNSSSPDRAAAASAAASFVS